MLIAALFGAAYAATKAIEKGAAMFRDGKEAAAYGELYRPVAILAPARGERPEVKLYAVLTPSEIQKLDPKEQTSVARNTAYKEAWT